MKASVLCYEYLRPSFVFLPSQLSVSMCPYFQCSCLASCKGLVFWQLTLKVYSAWSVLGKLAGLSVYLKCVFVCLPRFVYLCTLSTLWPCVRICEYPECMWMRVWDKKEMKSCSEELSHSEASPSVRLGLIVPGCEDIEKRDGSNCTRPLSQSYFCNIKRAPPARSRLLPCK